MRRNCRCCEAYNVILNSQSQSLSCADSNSNNGHCHFTGDREYFTIKALRSFFWSISEIVSGSWEFSGEFKAFNHARRRGTVSSCGSLLEEPWQVVSKQLSCGLWSTRTAEGRTGGVKCVVTLPQNVFPSPQLSAVLRVVKTCCMFVPNNAGWEKISNNYT